MANKYVYMHFGKVHEIISEVDPQFPNRTIEKRYSPDFLSKCEIMDEADIPPIGYIKKGNGQFEKPSPPVSANLQQQKAKLEAELNKINALIAAQN